MRLKELLKPKLNGTPPQRILWALLNAETDIIGLSLLTQDRSKNRLRTTRRILAKIGKSITINETQDSRGVMYYSISKDQYMKYLLKHSKRAIRSIEHTIKEIELLNISYFWGHLLEPLPSLKEIKSEMKASVEELKNDPNPDIRKPKRKS